MKKLKLFGAFLAAFLIVSASSSGVSSVLARDLNVPSGETIFYWSGGNTTVSVPSSFHWPTANISIVAYDNEGGNIGVGDTLFITLIIPVGGVPTAFPWAIITTNTEAIASEKLAFSGTPIYIHKADSKGVMQTLDNTFQVTSDELTVDRHGNSITVDFNPASTITLKFPNTPFWPTTYMGIPPALYSLVLPAFHLEIEKYGGSTHFTSSKTFTSTLPGLTLSGYTIATEQMGFHATAAFICPSWPTPVNTQTNSDAIVTMHGINTATPP
jgi:hypothetical protein